MDRLNSQNKTVKKTIDYKFSKNIETLKTINSYMISVVCSSSFIAIIFAALNIVPKGLLPIISVSSLIISVLSCLFFTKFSCVKISLKNLTLLLGILFWFFISYFRFDHLNFINNYLIEFLFYGGVIFIMLTFPISYIKILSGISSLSLLVLINPVTIIVNLIIISKGGYSTLPMGTSYAILPSVVASIIHFIYYRKNSSLVVKLSYIVNSLLLILLVYQGTRGVLIALLVLGYAILFTGFNNNTKVNIRRVFVWASLMIILLLFLNIDKVILAIYLYLQNIGVEVTALSKSVLKIQTEGLLNGRDTVYKNAVNLFLDNPLFGSGISSYAYYYPESSYPHNLIIQLLIEFGIIFSIPFILLFFKSLVVTFSPLRKDKTFNDIKIFIVFCFTVSIPRLMFSSYLWQDQIFWLLIFTLTGMRLKKKSIRNFEE